MNFFLFQIYPYIALTVLALGSIARYERDPFTWKSSSSQLLRRKQLILGSVLFHVGVLIVFFGHLVGLLTPIWVFDTLGIGHGFKQLLAILVGGVAGVFALVGGAMLLHRRLDRPAHPRHLELRRHRHPGAAARPARARDSARSSSRCSHLDGGEMVRFMTWSQAHLQLPRRRLGSWSRTPSWIFKLHIFLGLTIFLLFPFTRLVHMLSAPVRYLWRPGYQIVRSRRAAAPGIAGPAAAPLPATAPKPTAAAWPRPAE